LKLLRRRYAMMASASVGGGVIFIPERIERQIPRLEKYLSNDNDNDESE